jgi:hypothetical protein
MLACGSGEGCLLNRLLILTAVSLILLSAPVNLEAKQVGRQHAEKMVRGWLKASPRPLGSDLGHRIGSVETFSDSNGQPVYYVVYLEPRGFVIAPADDLGEPIVCFAAGGRFDPSTDNPLGALVSGDLPARVDIARSLEAAGGKGLGNSVAGLREAGMRSAEKWNKLVLFDDGGASITGVSTVSDERVPPLVKSKWGQDTVCSSACYNYYTPPYDDGNASNYPAGCVATAMAQLMRYHEYPTSGIGVLSFTIEVDGSPETAYTRGGDGAGGPYDWSLTALEPNCSSSPAQRQAIGALCYDAGVSVEMSYEAGGSGAYIWLARNVLPDVFGYDNAIDGWNNNDNIGTGLNGMVNPNLDAALPVLLGIRKGSSGHAIVADGYGYTGSTLYHHLNMGWDSYYDAWYNLPNIDSSPSFNVVDEVIYNIYVSGSGEIISGRVTSAGSGAPIADASVMAARSGGGTYNAATNARGIYALKNVPSSSTYTVTVSKSGYTFSQRVVSTGLSHHDVAVSGNYWGADFSGTMSAAPPVAYDGNASAERGADKTIDLVASDDGLPNPPGALIYIITSLPGYGSLADPCAGDINAVPYTLAGGGGQVVYTSLVCYTGADSFHFKASDGGVPPVGGDSNVATVSVNVVSPSEVVYDANFESGLPEGWSIIDGGSSTDTWMSENPAGRESPYWTGTFMLVDSDWTGFEDMDEQLITQNIDCTGLADVMLRFKHDFVYFSGDEVADVDIRVDGAPWQNAVRYQGSDYAGPVEISLSGFGADGDPNVQIRWHYYNANYDYYWGVDDVEVLGRMTGIAPPRGDFEPDCDVDWSDLGVLADAWLSEPGAPAWNGRCDISDPNDDVINGLDFAVFAQDWLLPVQ